MTFKGLKVVIRESGWVVDGKVMVTHANGVYTVISRSKLNEAQIMTALNNWEDAEFTKEILDIAEGRDIRSQ